MKKLGLIFLSLVFLFAVGCSASKDESAFLDAVKDKNVVFTIATVETVVGSFNANGKVYTITGGSVEYKYDSVESGTEATYKLGELDAKFTLDGKTLKIVGVTVGTLTKK